MQWADRSAKVATAQQVRTILRAAHAGDLTSRVSTPGKTGGFASLAHTDASMNHMASTVRPTAESAAPVSETCGDAHLALPGCTLLAEAIRAVSNIAHAAAQTARIIGVAASSPRTSPPSTLRPC